MAGNGAENAGRDDGNFFDSAGEKRSGADPWAASSAGVVQPEITEVIHNNNNNNNNNNNFTQFMVEETSMSDENLRKKRKKRILEVIAGESINQLISQSVNQSIIRGFSSNRQCA